MQTTVANGMYMGSTMNFGFSPQSSVSVYLPLQHSPHVSQPYMLKFLTKQIQICAGAGWDIVMTYVDIPHPPYHICIAHEETRQVTNPHTSSLFAQNSSTLSCQF